MCLEYEIDSQPKVHDLQLDQLPLNGLNMWLKSSVINYESIGSVPLWSDHRGNGVTMKVPFNHDAPSIFQLPKDNYPMLDFSNGDLRVEGADVIEESNGGGTFTGEIQVMRLKYFVQLRKKRITSITHSFYSGPSCRFLA